MLTCSTPVTDNSGKFLGCVSVDVELSQLQGLVNSFVTEAGGYAFILDSDGRYLATPDMSLVKNGLNITEEDNASLREAGNRIMGEDSGEVSFQKEGHRYRMYFSTISDINWKVIYQIPEASIAMPISELAVILLIIGLFMSLFIAADIVLITEKSIIHPITLLVNEFALIAGGNYDTNGSCALEKRKDEFGTLGTALNEMKFRLKQALREKEAALEANVAAMDELEQQNELLRTSEEQLMENIKYTQSIIGVIPDILFIISGKGIFLDCQGSAGTQLYAPKKEFIGMSIHDVMPTEIARIAMEKIQIVLEEGSLQRLKYNIEIAGQVENFELRISPYSSNKVIAIARMITEEETHLSQIEYLSYHDQVTGLHNRRFMDEELNRQESIGELPISIIFADVNGLKLINDSFGHADGDLLLKKFAAVLKNTCKENNFIARIGGDEFVVILPGTDEVAAELLMQELINNCSHENVNTLTLSVSIGYGTKSQKNQSIVDVLKSAEDMMYKKKLYDAPSRRAKTIEAIVASLYKKNPREEQHSKLVSQFCVAMADILDMSASEKEKIQRAALLHDIGKIGIPANILTKSDRLTPAEYTAICRHSEIGYRIMQSANDMTEIAEIILAHHERWDGNGYPAGLKSTEIPYLSRILAITEAYDAMTNIQSYQVSITEEAAAKEIIHNAGTQFDPELAYRFVQDVLHIDTDTL